MQNSILYFLGLSIFYFAHWLISILLVRYSGFEQAGIFSLSMSIGTIFHTLATFGMRQFQISDINNKFSDNEYVLSRKITSLISTCIFVIFLFIMQYPINYVLVIIGYYIFKLIEAYVDVYNGISQKNGEMWVSGVSFIIRGFLLLFIFFIQFRFNNSVILLVFLMSLSEFLCGVFFDNKMAKRVGSFSFKFTKTEFNNSFKLLFCTLSLMGYSVLSMIFNSIPKILLERFENATILGYYSSISAPTSIFSLFVLAIMLPIVPKLAVSYNNSDHKSIFKLLIISISLITLGASAGVVFSFFFGKQLLSYIFGEQILEYFNLLYYVIISVWMFGIVSILTSFLTAFRKLNSILIFSLISVVCVTIFSILYIKSQGIFGAVYAMIIALLIQLIFQSIYTIRTILSLKKAKV